MMRIKTPALFLVAVAGVCGTAWSAPLSGFYEAEVPVADQSAQNRPAAMAEAMRQVVVKVSGWSAVTNSPALTEAMKKPAPYVQRYSYRTREPADAELPVEMSIVFDRSRIDQLLQRAGYSSWDAARPLTMVWLAVEQGNQQILVGASDRGLVKEMVTRAAQRRALPLRLPLLDATDRVRVQAEDVWGDFHDKIIQASQRYEAQAVLVGRLGQLGAGRWQVRWTLYQGGTSQQWSQTGNQVEELVAYGIDMGTDALAMANTQTMGAITGNEIHWVVKGVRDMRSHRRVMDYLSALRGVTRVQLEQVNGDSVRLRITASSGETALRQQLANDNRLRAEAGVMALANTSELAQPGDTVFRLAP